MPSLFSEGEVSTIAINLGFEGTSEALKAVSAGLQAITDPNRYDEIQTVMTQIADLDRGITTAVTKSNVTGVGEIGLDYAGQSRRLKAEASRQLWRLSILCNLQIQYNRYLPNGIGCTHYA